jgi:hypothetical protein
MHYMDPFLHKFIELLMVICRELEKVMEVMARNCCTLQIQEATSRSLLTIGEPVTRLLLTASVKEDVDEATALVNGEQTVANLPATGTARFAWQALQSYLEKYKVMNPRLPVVVAESILTVDRHMELPLWLVDIFKASRLYFGLLSAFVSFPSTNPPIVRETGDIARRSKQPVPNSNT